MTGEQKRQKLAAGDTFVTREPGNSMVPIIRHNQKHSLAPCKYDDVCVGDVVFCRVRGSYMTHKVTAVNCKRGVQISNNRGHVNGWTKNVFGRVVEVYG